MVFQQNRGAQQDSFETGLPPAQSGEDVPRWLLILGLVAGLTLLVALLRYAVDLLGVVFVIILVGFAIRALSDWLTEGESVSAWAMSAVSVGLAGSVIVGLWLVNSRELTSATVQDHLPGPVQSTVAWLEHHGWGQRVLLSGSSSPGELGGGAGEAVRSVSAENADASDSGEPMTMAPQRSIPSLPATRAAARPPTQPVPSKAPGEAEAAPLAHTSDAVPSGVVSDSRPAAVPTSVTLTAWPTPVVVGRSVRLTAHVRSVDAQTLPTGTVVFSTDDAVLGRALVRNGAAVLGTLNLAIGDHTLSAAYEGDSAHLPSRSASITQTVARK
jgi:Bacterial Ig-like domain (group 3)